MAPETIRPTQGFVVLQFTPKEGTLILRPDGKRSPDDEIVVKAVGPDVPKEMGLKEGVKIRLRGDAQIYGIDDKQKVALVDFKMIMAVVEEPLKMLTNEELASLTEE